MTNYDLVPNDSSINPGVRSYGDSLEPLPRRQTHGTALERGQTFEAGVAPTNQADGLAPGEVRFRGRWLGADAAALADRLREIANDPGTTELSVQAVDESGTSVSDPVNGTYVIAEDIVVEQVVPGSDAAWRYDIRLAET
ncbi:MAG: hypothetical protein V5A34_05585 [Halapricum sp.]